MLQSMHSSDIRQKLRSGLLAMLAMAFILTGCAQPEPGSETAATTTTATTTEERQAQAGTLDLPEINLQGHVVQPATGAALVRTDEHPFLLPDRVPFQVEGESLMLSSLS